MKYLTLFLLIISLSCNKNKTCWKCTHPPSGASTCPTEKRVCSENGTIPPEAYKDCQGNDVGGTCVPD